MRISLLLPGFGPILDSLRQAEMAEQSGFDGVWIAEHVGFHDAPVTAALCLARTTRLEIGLMGLAPGSRHPAVTAMEIASLDEFAPGRIRIQLGTGDTALMNRIGIDSSKPAARVAALLRVVRSILDGETITHDSPAGSLLDFSLGRPESACAIPLDVLAIRPKMLALAAEHGDGVCMTAGASRGYIHSTIERMRETRSSCGLSGKPFRATAVVFVLISDEWGKHLVSLANMLGGFSTALAPVIFRGALTESDLERFTKRDQEERAALFTPDVIREVAIMCEPASVESALASWFELGLDEMCIFPVGPEELLAPALTSIGAAVSSLRARWCPKSSISNRED